jgi:L-threonylcarbamoyladenylate synthase
LIVHLPDAAALGAWAARVPAAAERLARAFWPGPLTLILPRAKGVIDEVTGGQPTVGLRVPSHPLALALLGAFGGGIAAPSANRFGRVSPTTAAHVRAEFGAEVPLVLDGGDCSVGLESTIVSCVDELLLLRPGGIALPDLEAIAGPIRRAERGEGPRASGTLAAHYAPRTPLRVLAAEALRASAGASVAVLARSARPADYAGPLWIEAAAGAAGFGHDLYADLRRLDASGAAAILVEEVPAGAPWDAVRDRLARAAAACDAEDLA